MLILHAASTALDEARFGVLHLAEPLPYGEDAVHTALVMHAPFGGDETEKQILGTVSAHIAEHPSFTDILAQWGADEMRRELEYVFEEHFRERLEQLL